MDNILLARIIKLEKIINSITGGVEYSHLDWSDIENKPTSFPSETHDHDSLYYSKDFIDKNLKVPWTRVSNKPNSYPPSKHEHKEYVKKEELEDLIDDLSVEEGGEITREEYELLKDAIGTIVGVLTSQQAIGAMGRKVLSAVSDSLEGGE